MQRTPRSIRFDEEEETLAELAARREGLASFSAFVRRAARERALRVLGGAADGENDPNRQDGGNRAD